jgi:hypothetical protein
MHENYRSARRPEHGKRPTLYRAQLDDCLGAIAGLARSPGSPFMRASALSLAIVIGLIAGPASAGPADILAANKVASGGSAWDHPGALALDYAYAGQGLTGSTHTRFKLAGNGFVDSYTIGPQSGANGFDGANAWVQDPSGIVSDQKGGDVLQLAFNEAYRDGNLWWRADFGGARLAEGAPVTENGTRYIVLSVEPRGGKPFAAWFDSGNHLLARTIEVQGSQTITSFFSDYAAERGMIIPHKIVVDDGTGPANRQTQTLTAARLLPPEPETNFAAPQVAVHDARLPAGTTETTVPFELVNNHIYADVSVNGSKPLLFIFDTGGHSLLTPEAAKELRITAQGSQTATGGGAGFMQSGITRVASISIGDATITDQPVSVVNFTSPQIEGVDVKGMVGYEFFARFVTRFDYGTHRITFIDKHHFDPASAGTAVPIVLYNQLPQFAGSYDGIPADFCIDTGNRAGLILTKPFVAKHDLRARAGNGTVAMTGWGIGGPTYSFVTHGGVLKLGDAEIDHPLVTMSTDKGGSDAAEAFPNNVGGGVLKRFVVTLDYDHYTMYLKPVSGPVADLDTFDRSGLWINGDAAGFKIIDVTRGGPAERAGLKSGDIIVAVDGKPAHAIALYDLRQRLREETPGTTVTFSVRQGTAARDVPVTLRDLL